MFIVIVTRVVKVNTGATEKFSPRTSNRISEHAAGPFQTHKIAQRAVLTALSTHTCLGAEVWSGGQVRAELEKSSGSMPHERWLTLRTAARMLDGAR